MHIELETMEFGAVGSFRVLVGRIDGFLQKKTICVFDVWIVAIRGVQNAMRMGAKKTIIHCCTNLHNGKIQGARTLCCHGRGHRLGYIQPATTSP